jgi:hypothetical protein
MITVGQNKFFTEEDFEIRKNLVQRSINFLSDTDKYDQFSAELKEFLDRFEDKHGTNKKVRF